MTLKTTVTGRYYEVLSHLQDQIPVKKSKNVRVTIEWID